jgi:hypothetical protein
MAPLTREIHMKKLFFLCLLAALLPIFGCADMSPEDNRRFRSEVDENLSVGMALNKATERLTKLGFSCDDRSSAPEITCTRDRDAFLYSCIQRVNLDADPKRQTVVAVTPAGISCLGGF